MEDNNIILYTTGCPKCGMLTKKLKANNINYTVVDDVEKIQSKGISAVPMLEVDDMLMNFAQAWAWIEDNTQKGLNK